LQKCFLIPPNWFYGRGLASTNEKGNKKKKVTKTLGRGKEDENNKRRRK